MPAAARPLIARRTGFGTRGAYVASLKGVSLSLKPAAQLVDLRHGVASHHTLAGPAVAGCPMRGQPRAG
jgi:S-adenosylmethionine hydrolase